MYLTVDGYIIAGLKIKPYSQVQLLQPLNYKTSPLLRPPMSQKQPISMYMSVSLFTQLHYLYHYTIYTTTLFRPLHYLHCYAI